MSSSKPAGIAALFIIGGIGLSLYVDVPLGIALGVCFSALLISGALFLLRAPQGITFLLLAISVLSLGFLRGTESLARVERRQVADFASRHRTATGFGRINRMEAQSPERGSLILSNVALIAENDTLPLRSLRIEIRAPLPWPSVQPGDWFLTQGALRLPEDPRIPGQIGPIRDAVTERVAVYLYMKDSTRFSIFPSKQRTLSRILHRVREEIAGTLKRNLSPQAFALCNALLLGDRSSFSHEFHQQIRATGLSHIFALSGLNVGLVASIIWLVAAIVGLPFSLRIWLAILATVFYVALGFGMPSLVRAGVMAILFLVSHLIHRKAHVLNIVGAAASLELLWRPMDLVDMGFQLSYLAVLGMVLTYSWLRSAFTKVLGFQIFTKRALRSVLDVGFATVGAQIGTLPLLTALFGTVPFLGLLANLVAVPAFSILLWWEIFLLLVAPISHALSASIGATINLFSDFLHAFVEWFSSLPAASLTTGYFSPIALGVVYLGLGIAWLQRKEFEWKRAALGALIILNALIWPGVFQWKNARFEMYFFDVGNGDSILLRTPHGKTLLIDAGSAFDSWDASWRILPALKSLGVGRLDALILTHAETDHIGGAAKILREFPVGAVYTNGISHTTEAYQELIHAMKAKGLKEKSLIAGDMVRELNPFPIWILSPDSLWRMQARTQNQKSLVLRVAFGQATALFASDIDSATEQRLLPWGSLLESDLLKVAHHGSAGASSAKFLSAVRPKLAVITAGRNNPHGHPAENVLHRLRGSCTPFYVAGEQGTILCVSDGQTVERALWRKTNLAHQWHLPMN